MSPYITLALTLAIMAQLEPRIKAIDIEGCNTLMDLLFIVDCSRSVLDADPVGQEGHMWSSIKNFTRGVVRHLPVGQQTKVAAIRYASRAEVVFHLAQHNTPVTAEDALLSMDYMGGNTNTAAALRLAWTQVFDGNYGARAAARNVVVHIGDGIDNVETEHLENEMSHIKEYSHAEVYAVGVTREILPDQLQRLASRPPGSHFLHAPSVSDLDLIQSYLVRRICQLPDPDVPLPSEPGCPMPGCKTCDSIRCYVCDDGKFMLNDICTDCMAKCRVCNSLSSCVQCSSGWFWVPVLNKCEACELVADLALVIDNSGSIRDKNPADNSYDNYQLLKDFLNRLLERLDVGENVTRVGAIKFSSKSQLVFHLDTYTHRSMIQQAILEMDFGGGHTNISGALRMMRNELFQRRRGDRPDVGNIALIITDGESTIDKNITIEEANSAKEEGITLFVVGVTDEINENELKTITSPPVADHYFNSTDIRNLDELLDSLIRQVCNPGMVKVP